MSTYSGWLAGGNSIFVNLEGRGRPDFYSLLLPRIIEEDQQTGTMSFLDHWDDPDAEIHAWDQQDPFVAVWDRVGFRPVIQRLFFCLEREHGTLLEEIDAMDDLTDPNKCPEEFLPFMAASLGHDLRDDIEVEEKRVTVNGLITAYKERGTPLSWSVFFRMLGYRIIFYPLWKKAFAEENDQYDPVRYAQVTAFGPIVLPGIFVSSLVQAPLKPTSIFITDGVETFRDNGKGQLIGSLGGSGSVNYLTGAMQIVFAPVGPAGPVTMTGETVVDEFPYHAARVDFDFFLVPLKGGPSPSVDNEFIKLLRKQLEEVRPIHVLIRTLNLIQNFEEELENFAADGGCCGPSLGVDHWTAAEHFYVGDRGPIGLDNGLLISRTDGNEHEILEDVTPFIHPLKGDPLVITSIPPQGFDGAY